jgi:hypothetical protein
VKPKSYSLPKMAPPGSSSSAAASNATTTALCCAAAAAGGAALALGVVRAWPHLVEEYLGMYVHHHVAREREWE